jgi:plasmid stabilization system protein ParE
LRTWWEDNRSAAPDAVADDIEAAITMLLVQPGVGQRVPQASGPNTRRLHLQRLSHWLYYRYTDTELTVLTIWSTSRDRQPSI